MKTIEIKKTNVGGDFSKAVTLEPKKTTKIVAPYPKGSKEREEFLQKIRSPSVGGNVANGHTTYWSTRLRILSSTMANLRSTLPQTSKKYSVIVTIGDGLFSKSEGEYIIPDDLNSYTFEYSPRESTSIVKKLLKFGLAAASAEFALGGTRRAGRIGMGAASLLLGKAALRTNTKKFKGYVVTTLQFSDHKILTFEMKMKDWTSFDEEIHVLTFPEADKEFHKIKDVLEDEVTVIREQFASLSKEDKKAATSRIKEVEETIQFQGKQHKKRGKIAKKRTSTSIWTKPKITILVVIVFLLIIAVT